MFQDIPIKKLYPSKSNYRRSCNEAAMEELTASIKSKGVLQPILVRPLSGKQKGSFEIVAGHRRFTAAKEAGLKDIPALVKELSDEDALECQVIENHQREDVNLMDEAEGFKRLLDMGKHTPETLAAKIDCSVSYVLGRVKLLDLDEKVQDAIASGEIGPGHAVLFTRLKDSADQKKLLKEIFDNEMSVRAAKAYIKRYCSLAMKDAPFDTAECSTCPSRSRNQTVLFEDLKKTDECTDKACFYAKTKHHYKVLLDGKKAKGFKVYTDEKKIKALLNEKGSTAIAGVKVEASYSKPYPPEYKKQCMKCTEHHAFFIREEKYESRTDISFGELCLNRTCLTAMESAGKRAARQASATGSPDASGPNQTNIRQAARECRDRFLLSALPARLETDNYLIKKLLILQLYRTRSFLAAPAFLKELVGETVSSYEGDAGVYKKFTEKFPGKDDPGTLSYALTKALLLTLDRPLCDALLALAPEAGVVMSRDFVVDEPWLKGKTKGELAALIKELALDIEVKASAKKGDLISAILAQDLKGKVPKEFEEVLKVADVAGANDDCCDECGFEPDLCTCEGGSNLPEPESGDASNGNGEDEYPETSSTPSPSMGEGRGEGEDPDPSMPQPTATKRKRKPRARA